MVSASALRYRAASVDMSHRSTFIPAFAWAFSLGLFVVSNVAVAAPPPTVGGGGSGPEAEACAGRAVGDACTLPNRALGTCGQGTCNRLDYSQGSPPKAIEEPCVVCKPAEGHGSEPMLGGTTTGDSGDSAATSAASGSADGGAKEPPKSESRCRIGTTPDPLGFAGLALLLLLARVRKVRRD